MARSENAMWNEVEYNVLSVEKIDPPDGMEGANWYRYIIGRGASTMVGNRRGTLKRVTEHARTLVKDLNARSGRNGKSLWAPARTRQSHQALRKRINFTSRMAANGSTSPIVVTLINKSPSWE